MNTHIQETLNPPEVEGVVNYTLDLADFPSVRNVKVYWPGMQENDSVQIFWMILASGESPYEDPRPVVEDGIEVWFDIPREHALLSEGSEVLVQYHVTRNDEEPIVSPPSIFLVLPQDVAPFIDDVYEEGGQQYIGDGGSTGASSVELRGRASPNQLVKIFDNDVYKGQVRVNPRGIWSFLDSQIDVGPHVYVAEAVYRSNLSSEPRTVIRVEKLEIDHSLLILDGVHLHPGYPLTGEWSRTEGAYRPNVRVQREATGGQPPYRYTSLDPAIASVDSTGLVTSQADGSAVIEVRDDSIQVARFSVTCSNNFALHASVQETSFTFAQALEWVEQSPLNYPIPHRSTPLGTEILRDLQNHTSHAAEHHEFHTATVSPESTDLTDLVVAWSLEEGGQVSEIGPVGLDRLARAICIRDL